MADINTTLNNIQDEAVQTLVAENVRKLLESKLPVPMKVDNKINLAKENNFMKAAYLANALFDAAEGAYNTKENLNSKNPGLSEYLQSAGGGLLQGLSLGVIDSKEAARALNAASKEPYESEIMKKISNSDAVGLALRALGY